MHIYGNGKIAIIIFILFFKSKHVFQYPYQERNNWVFFYKTGVIYSKVLTPIQKGKWDIVLFHGKIIPAVCPYPLQETFIAHATHPHFYYEHGQIICR